MSLPKLKIGDYILQYNINNEKYRILKVINVEPYIIKVLQSSYKLDVDNTCLLFSYNFSTSGWRGKKLKNKDEVMVEML